MKLITVNMEGARHLSRVSELITREQPDCLCFQEMPSGFIPTLQNLGYHITFAPMMYNQDTAPQDCIGVGIASRTPAKSTIHYYFGNTGPVIPYDKSQEHGTTNTPCILSEITIDHTLYRIATTHLPVTPDGHETPEQNQAVTALLGHLQTAEPHLLCGDMNMPRGYNANYPAFAAHYTDTVPTHYASSLDRELHRLGQRTDLNFPIFDFYMVDYIFSQPPYTTGDVRLEFGISDHAAVIATVTAQ